MPEFVHTFQNGKMNKDLDERLVPNGQYRDALNLDLANSEGSNVGTLQNVKGNVELRGKANDLNGWQANYIEDLSNPVCIGSIKNDIDEKIYWFIASDSVSAIAELDTTTGYIHPILVDKNNILKFDEDYLITGINIIDKFIFWTDDQTEPKRININKFKAGSCDFNTHTKIPDYVPNDDVYVTVNCGSLSSYDDFTEEDIVVIKKSPLTAPSLVLAATPFGTNPDGSQISGVGISPVNTQGDQPIPGETTGFENFTYIPNVANFPEIYESLPTYGEYQQNIADEPLYYQDSNLPSNWNGNIVFNVSPIYGNNPTNGQPVWKPFDFLVLSGTFEDDNETFEYSLRVLIISLNNTEVTAQIQGISANILKVPGTSGAAQLVQWEVLLEEEQPMFEFVFPRFAYRWKYIDNEYSTFSPFSSVAFVGSEFKYLSSDGHNIGMTNNIRKLIIESLELGTEEVDEIEILYKESHNTAVYSVDSIKKKDFAPYNSSAGPTPTSFEIKSEIIGSVIQPNQLLRPWDNVPLYAKSQEIVGNRIVYGNYVQNYTVDPTLEIDVNIQPLIHQGSLGPTAEAVALIDPADNDFTRMPFLSLKTIRTYQVGVVFKDEYGRETPVFTNKSASIINDIRNSDARNRLIVRPNSNPPSWATHFKYFVKETSNE